MNHPAEIRFPFFREESDSKREIRQTAWYSIYTFRLHADLKKFSIHHRVFFDSRPMVFDTDIRLKTDSSLHSIHGEL
ncbi:MAG TPA: hypothetical protein DCM07_10760 [Planctomycetaceae bacterium]|nr:hypothetical protein [Gimesia sp.]HAH45312.1 hypothetical protein [Planctomycetaceae bacterium]